MKLYLQNIVESIQLETLPSEWLSFDFVKFSDKKILFDYQQQALKNAVKALYKYYVDCKQDKTLLFNIYKANGFTEDLDLKLNGSKKYKIFQEFSNDYKIEGNKIAFSHFINRMSFWMATGSGKTLVIVKLLELLGFLIKKELIPNHEILFLTYRGDLIDQAKHHIDEFNRSSNFFYITLYDLKDYEKIKRENKLKYQNHIDVFYYRSDLISDEQKDKIIDFRNYDNFGKWYILLDEAHKGDKEDSKRQLYYSLLSRNGFLFNFSATFTDPIDFASCVFNFNLEKFIQQGYGKHIYISQSSINELGEKNDFTEKQKQIIILKILLLHTVIRISKPQDYYHNPLILTLVNSVNTEDSDLYLFFKEIEKVAKGDVDNKLLNEAKNELKIDLQGKYEFENEQIKFDDIILKNLTFNDVLKKVFNAKTNGEIEVLKIPGNNQEIILKLKTSDRPFALIKIGDISEWIKNKLSGYQIIEKFENESVFRNINKEDSDIKILMGSRAFYEGWDSNRPNIILYINIGKGISAKKFVLQSIGRGVRIEPLPNKRKRLQFLYNNNEINNNEYKKIKNDKNFNDINFIETLFVYGTKAENLKEVMETLKQEKQEELLGNLFEINPEIKGKLLLIPTYKESERILCEENISLKLELNREDLKLVENYYNYIGDKLALVKFDCKPKILKKIKESFDSKNNIYKENTNIDLIEKPEILFKQIMNYFSIRSKEFKEFKPLENEIIHFKQIKISIDKLNKLKEKIEKVTKFPEKAKIETELKNKFKNNEIDIDTFTNEIRKIDQYYLKEIKENSLKIKYIQNHYYIPLCLSEDEKIDYIMHIIKTKSEVDFINELESYLQKENNFFKQFDWWFFSKIDEILDEVYIPYYQPKTNRIEKFKPDFIFWFHKDTCYYIVFIDPKSVSYSDANYKIDGYKRLFEENNRQKIFDIAISDKKYKVCLLLYMWGKGNTGEEYADYWITEFDNLYNATKTLFPNCMKS